MPLIICWLNEAKPSTVVSASVKNNFFMVINFGEYNIIPHTKAFTLN